MRIWIYNNIIWYLKQLLPLMYVSEYTEPPQTDDGFAQRKLTIWRMWFGRSFGIRTYELATTLSGDSLPLKTSD